ncbi:hypothetical protein N7520_008425 [Penicillium odoratum]|uniref:uncharacterized protein n=1 Tax=Penicillium odoratum TaxID=1167516 RepID=UPI0025472EAF|nr:uncharacterized protein N7520_008425 [Penicillium odoratum]KAJ5761269.1 hypothetical protein N7520_008425 [Penicillium odoratum]
MTFLFRSGAHYAQLPDTEQSDEPHHSHLQDASGLIEEARQNLGKRKFSLFASVRRSSYLRYQERQCGTSWNQLESLPDGERAIEYETQRFKGSFGLESPFTGIGPAVDAAWDNITNGPAGGAIGITKEQWEAVNQYPEYPVMLETDHGTGRYLASLDVFHQLHFVDLLRKNIHREYYDKHEGSFAGAPKRVIEGHLEHCIETLRQMLMCHGDISLLTYNWVAGRDMPYPNFNTIHTCKKWEKISAVEHET